MSTVLRRIVAALTSLLVMLGGVLVLVAGPATAAPARAGALAAASSIPTSSPATGRATTRKPGDQKRAARQKTARRTTARQRAAERRRHLARWAKVRPRHPETWLKWAPGRVSPVVGPLFNDPYGDPVQRRRLVKHVVRTINASPGYRLRGPGRKGLRLKCPTDPADAPSQIKIAVYSIADQEFTDALLAANRRCVSVQVLMNSHLTSVTSPSWGRIIAALGARGNGWRHRRSFAHRCSNGCLGTSTLHSKIFLFSRSGTARDTVMVGSSNMTRNAVRVQWNDLYTVNNHPTMFRQYRTMFERMVPDVMAQGPFVFPATGRYQSTFYPFRAANQRTDTTVRSLRTVRCRGATGGTGVRGRTIVYVEMHAWFGDRGRAITRQLRGLYDRGCHIRILYSFMLKRTHDELTEGTGRRMLLRRVAFPQPYGVLADKYSHLKMYAVSGHIGKDRSAEVVWTGSNNWTDKSDHGDEVTLRIASSAAYRAYVRHWKFVRDSHSSPFWALFEEPVGGGRAP